MTTDPGTGSTDRSPYRDVSRQKLLHRSVVEVEITIPAAPGMIAEYVELCANIFEDVGRRFIDDLARLKAVWEGQRAETFKAAHTL